MAALKQGVLVVEAYANSEREVGKVIQEAVSKAITQLNQEGKRVVNITTGPSIKYMLGTNHLTHILWESSGKLVGSSTQSNVPKNALYDVVLIDNGNKKVKVAIAIMEVLKCEFEDALKYSVDGNTCIKAGLLFDDAQKIGAHLKKAGANVEIREH